MLLLERDVNTGKIHDAATGRSVVTFSGGFFRPFTNDSANGARRPENALVTGPGAGTEIFLQFPRDSVCTDDNAGNLRRKQNSGCDCDGITPARRSNWSWTDAIKYLSDHKINLVRVFGMNGVEFRTREGNPVDVYPFLGTPGAWQVKDAVVGGRFNRAYFDEYLRPFVKAADDAGIAVQFCLFSFHDFTNENGHWFKYFPVAPWNAAATVPEDWRGNLVPATGLTAIRRNIYFTNKNNPITAVQNWWVGCVVQTLRGFGNVIYELFNEPRSIWEETRPDDTKVVHNHRADLADWYDWLIERIFYWNGTFRRPLISVNAVPDYDLAAGEVDIDVWRARPGNRFADVDIVSYHGLTGYEAVRRAPCVGFQDFAPVTLSNITARIGSDLPKYAKQALLFSTDAVKNPTHTYTDTERPADPADPDNKPAAGLELDKRDGQVQTTTPVEGRPFEEQLLYSDLYDWAFWTLREGYKPENRGRVHFQNHSIFRASFDSIWMARVATEPRGSVVAPAYTTADWTQYRWLSDPNAARNFWWAQRNLVAEGGSVTQLGTVEAPADPRWEMTVETGWRCNFAAAAAGPCCFLVSYTPVSVSTRSQGAAVSPMIVARLHEVAAGGALGPVLSRADALVAPGATAGTLGVCATLVAGRQYALVMTGAVKVNYRNRYQGYGEVIVHFPSIRKVMP